MIFYSDFIVNLINTVCQKTFDGYAFLFFIFVRKDAGQDLIEHEKVHVQQFLKNPLFPLIYMVSQRKRMEYEAEAYRASMKHGMKFKRALQLLSQEYGLSKISISEITRELLKT